MSEENLSSYDHLSLSKLFYQKSLRNRQRLLDGIPTLIPFRSFKRLSKFIPGITHGEQVIITSNTGGGKSRFTRFLFINEVMEFAKSSGFKVKIFLNSLEESSSKVTSTLTAAELYNLYGKSTNYYELTNTALKANSEEEMKMIKRACEEVDRKYAKVLQVEHVNDPLQFYLKIRDYLKEVGKFYVAKYKDGIVVDKKIWNSSKDGVWNYYEYDEPTIVIAISDTIDKYQPTEVMIGSTKRVLSKYETVRYFSEVFSRQRLGLVCDVISVQVSQQSEDNEKANTLASGKKDVWRIKPNLGNLLTVRAIGQDATLALGIFDPAKHHLFSYLEDELNYPETDISRMNGCKYRSLMILKTREGELAPPDNEIPMACFFDRDYFEELPVPDDKKLWNYFNKPGLFNANKIA